MSITPLITPGLGGGALPPWSSPVGVTVYEIGTGEFTGTTYDLQLLRPLVPDYFVLINGCSDNGNAIVNRHAARVSADPFGSGELGTSSGPSVLTLTRGNATGNWVGTVTVVESALNQSTAGFTLVDVLVTSLAASGGAPDAQNDTSAAWGTLGQVVPYGGFRGGGMSTAAGSGDDWSTVYPTVGVSGTTTVTFTRYGPASQVEAATATTYIVEWGSEWNVQSVAFSHTAGGDGCDATGEYGTGSISSVDRDNTWVWSTHGHSGCVGFGCGPADVPFGGAATIMTLGDGVNQNASETSVAAGAEVTNQRHTIAYVLEHPRLAVDYRFKADGDNGVTSKAVTVDAAAGLETYDEVSNPAVTAGSRLPIVYVSTRPVGIEATRLHHQGVWMWARHTASGNVDVKRTSSYTPTWPGWLQSIDFSAV